MPFKNPTFGFPLRKAAKIIVFLDVVAALLIFVPLLTVEGPSMGMLKHDALFTKLFYNHKDRQYMLAQIGKDQYNKLIENMDFLVSHDTVILLWIIVEGFLGTLLYRASTKGDAGRCGSWIRGRIITLLIQFCFTIYVVSDFGFEWMAAIVIFIQVVRVYGVLVVSKLKKELELDAANPLEEL